MVFSWSYFIFMLPCFIISLICNISVKSNFSKYSQISNSRGLTGVQAAMNVLKANSVSGVRFERVGGSMTDHFDPRNNVIRLSETFIEHLIATCITPWIPYCPSISYVV